MRVQTFNKLLNESVQLGTSSRGLDEAKKKEDGRGKHILAFIKKKGKNPDDYKFTGKEHEGDTTTLNYQHKKTKKKMTVAVRRGKGMTLTEEKDEFDGLVFAGNEPIITEDDLSNKVHKKKLLLIEKLKHIRYEYLQNLSDEADKPVPYLIRQYLMKREIPHQDNPDNESLDVYFADEKQERKFEEWLENNIKA